MHRKSAQYALAPTRSGLSIWWAACTFLLISCSQETEAEGFDAPPGLHEIQATPLTATQTLIITEACVAASKVEPPLVAVKLRYHWIVGNRDECKVSPDRSSCEMVIVQSGGGACSGSVHVLPPATVVSPGSYLFETMLVGSGSRDAKRARDIAQLVLTGTTDASIYVMEVDGQVSPIYNLITLVDFSDRIEIIRNWE